MIKITKIRKQIEKIINQKSKVKEKKENCKKSNGIFAILPFSDEKITKTQTRHARLKCRNVKNCRNEECSTGKEAIKTIQSIVDCWYQKQSQNS